MLAILLMVSTTVVLANLVTDVVHRLIEHAARTHMTAFTSPPMDTARVEPAPPAYVKPGFRRLLLQRLGTRIALGWSPLVLVLAFAAPLVTGYDPLSGGDNALQPPLTPGHWLGTDDLGRDIWTRVVYGTRVSLTG